MLPKLGISTCITFIPSGYVTFKSTLFVLSDNKLFLCVVNVPYGGNQLTTVYIYNFK